MRLRHSYFPLTISLRSALIIGIIVVSGLFMRRVLNALLSSIGKDILSIVVWTLFFAVFFALLPALRAMSRERLLRFIFICLVGLAYALSLDIFEERVHLIKYGILGWSIFFDQAEDTHWRGLIRSVLAVFLVGATD